MSEDILPKLLLDNGFTNSPMRWIEGMYYNIININILELEPIITSINVGHNEDNEKYTVFIVCLPEAYAKPNFGIDSSTDMSGYKISDHRGCDIYNVFNNKDDFINELCRLNSIGLNTKRAII